MAIIIDNPEVEEMALRLAKQMGKSVDEVVSSAIRERLNRAKAVHEAVLDFRSEIAGLPVADARTADEILGYDEFGLPH